MGTPLKVTLVGDSMSNTKLNKSLSYNNIDLVKSMPKNEPKSYFEDPVAFCEVGNFKEKPSSLSYSTLHQMSVRNSVVSAIINTRVNQVSTFTRPARFTDDNIGFVIKLKNRTKTPTKEQEKIIEALESFLENTGYSNNNDRDSFDTFIRKLVRDSLVYDQATFEIVPDRQGRPAEVYAVDASTIRIATEDYKPDNSYGMPKNKKNEEVSYVQVIDGTVVSWFTANELAFGVRNPRSDIRVGSYGFSELEMLINQITSYLYTESYNERFFSQGGTTKGILNIRSDPNGIGNREQLESFKRQWQAQVSTTTNSWKTPVLQVPEGIEYINIQQSNRDMEYNQWLNYLINMVCAVYQIDPAEVNFANNGGATGQSSVFESSQEHKLKNSKDKGLKPLLRFIEDIINKNIISRFSEEYIFVFTGLDDKTESEKADLYSKEVKVFKTINEIRQENDMEPLPQGDVILDASFLNYIQQQAMAQQGDMGMGEQMEDDGDEGNDYSDYDTGGESEEESYSDYLQGNTEQEEQVEKSLNKLIITIED